MLLYRNVRESTSDDINNSTRITALIFTIADDNYYSKLRAYKDRRIKSTFN